MKKRIATLVILTAASGAFACPMCKDSVGNKEGGESTQLRDAYTTNGQNISGGLNTSIYVMLATLMGVLGLVSTVIVKGVRSSGGGDRAEKR